VTVVGISLDEHGYDTARALAYHREVLPALQAAGEFETVSLSALAPFGSSHLVRIVPPDGNPLSVSSNGISESYFRLLSIPIVRGRAFTVDEAAGAGDGAPLIVNETLARRLFGSLDVVGRTVRLARTGANPEQDLVIVGVARDSRWRSIAGKQDAFLYRPFGHFGYGIRRGVYMIKSNLPSRRAGEIANALAARTASAVPLWLPWPLSSGIASHQRFFAWMLSVRAALGFVLAALGHYGLIAQTTTERRREFGIRLALGAARRDIARLVVRFGLVVSSVGIVIGLSLSFYGTRVIQSMLFGVSPLDGVIHVAAIFTLTAVVALACAWPAWQATRVPLGFGNCLLHYDRYSAATIAAVTSLVLAVPPRSGVLGPPPDSTRSMAAMMRSWADVSPRWSSIMAPAQMAPMGLAIPFTAMSGADP
jgi:hypothetical protein